MKCPRCERTVLDEHIRDGVVVDVCRGCRGVWLDRGELEKIIAAARRAEDDDGDDDDDPPPARGARRHRDDDDHDHDHDHDGQRRDPRRKRSWFDSLGDLFG